MPPLIQAGGEAMVAVRIQYAEDVRVPGWVQDLPSFLRWTEAPEFPEEGRIDYLGDEVWIDMAKQQIFTHVRIKTIMTATLSRLTEEIDAGVFLADGAYVVHPEANLAAVPDAVYMSHETIQQMRAQIAEGKTQGHVHIEGSPDMVLEVVSDSSVEKDTEVLRGLYWKAGIQEYWLVDARKDPLAFDILRHGPRGFVPTRKQGGWVKSAVFGKSFCLTSKQDRGGLQTWKLEMK
jgi:Uma2 family endonuclease